MLSIDAPREERTSEQARRRTPMNAAQVRAVIDTMERDTRSRAARIAMAKAAIRIGNITPDGKDVYRKYLEELGAL